ncbi:hypothetical protein B0H17DRAFT_1041329 [Mycena rosella]|uniref:Uncharacterized protein n=1 Tax=Mycena rosella TaxID=1033263 RepID=A0AAD7GN94_MYCRO|nr:hypothetical protein B0H17DRAFT_1041329 [Mycena rosella]
MLRPARPGNGSRRPPFVSAQRVGSGLRRVPRRLLRQGPIRRLFLPQRRQATLHVQTLRQQGPQGSRRKL